MLTSVQIRVQEETADKAVEALTKYEHAIQLVEVERYRLYETRPQSVPSNSDEIAAKQGEILHAQLGAPAVWAVPWNVDIVTRSHYNEELGRELAEEVIEFDESIPGYRGRRVVRFARIDLRSPFFREGARPDSG